MPLDKGKLKYVKIRTDCIEIKCTNVKKFELYMTIAQQLIWSNGGIQC